MPAFTIDHLTTTTIITRWDGQRNQVSPLAGKKRTLLEIIEGVNRLALVTDLKVQMGAGGVARIAAVGDHGTPGDVLSHLDRDSRQVSVTRFDVVAMIDDDEVPIAAVPTSKAHPAPGGGFHRGSRIDSDVDAVVHSSPTGAVT